MQTKQQKYPTKLLEHLKRKGELHKLSSFHLENETRASNTVSNEEEKTTD